MTLANVLYRTIVHEFIHALGVYHMHQRSDRDKYVKINWENIKESDKFNFDKLNDAVFFDVPYDAKSMMHYQTIGHTSKNGKPTIESLVNINRNTLQTNKNHNQNWILR